ncbi:hypothetical protein PROFUN_14208 [Planoprotostelium fungivorum]|uniref:Uncharacterized protein n=1 Tax=Planoprotostelium fungivorum TaxID=1890364 RepID=A0A2P6N0K7_9EUKA|nr:hypothetical protein PROFUN_14208 [Planoprotostelium fungivorum]
MPQTDFISPPTPASLHLAQAISENTQTGKRPLADILEDEKTAHRARLDKMGLKDEDAFKIAKVIAKSTPLKLLSLSHNQITESGAIALATSLTGNQNLAAFHIDGNAIGDGGAAAFAGCLTGNDFLRILHINDCKIEQRGVAALAGALHTNRVLESLGLSGSLFGDQGAALLAEALKANGTLRSLSLSNCNITEEGAKLLLDVIRDSKHLSLRSLNLDGNQIGPETLNTFRELLGKNSMSSSQDARPSSGPGTAIAPALTAGGAQLSENPIPAGPRRGKVSDFLRGALMAHRGKKSSAELTNSLDERKLDKTLRNNHDRMAAITALIEERKKREDELEQKDNALKEKKAQLASTARELEKEARELEHKEKKLKERLKRAEKTQKALKKTRDTRKSPGYMSSDEESEAEFMDDSAINAVVVGDSSVGKTALLTSFALQMGATSLLEESQMDDAEKKFRTFNINGMMVDTEPASLNLVDTESDPTFSRFRILNYKMCDVFLLMFSVIDRNSFVNAVYEWHEELEFNQPQVPVILVGTKCDVREALGDNVPEDYVTHSQGESLAAEIHAVGYFEIALNNPETIETLFESVVQLQRLRNSTLGETKVAAPIDTQYYLSTRNIGGNVKVPLGQASMAEFRANREQNREAEVEEEEGEEAPPLHSVMRDSATREGKQSRFRSKISRLRGKGKEDGHHAQEHPTTVADYSDKKKDKKKGDKKKKKDKKDILSPEIEKKSMSNMNNTLSNTSSSISNMNQNIRDTPSSTDTSVTTEYTHAKEIPSSDSVVVSTTEIDTQTSASLFPPLLEGKKDEEPDEQVARLKKMLTDREKEILSLQEEVKRQKKQQTPNGLAEERRRVEEEKALIAEQWAAIEHEAAENARVTDESLTEIEEARAMLRDEHKARTAERRRRELATEEQTERLRQLRRQLDDRWHAILIREEPGEISEKRRGIDMERKQLEQARIELEDARNKWNIDKLEEEEAMNSIMDELRGREEKLSRDKQRLRNAARSHNEAVRRFDDEMKEVEREFREERAKIEEEKRNLLSLQNGK